MNVLLKGREVAFYLGDSGARALIAWSDFADGYFFIVDARRT